MQQIIALIIVAYFISRIIIQKKRGSLSNGEFWFWLVFWLTAGVLVIAIKKIDTLVASVGFSGSGIEVLLYLSVTMLFYFIFKLRLRLAKVDRDIAEIVKQIAINNQQK